MPMQSQRVSAKSQEGTALRADLIHADVYSDKMGTALVADLSESLPDANGKESN